MDDLVQMQAEGRVPEINDEFPMELIAERMLQSVQLNFLLGGRPNPWIVKQPNETPLVGSGKLYNSLTKTFGKDWAEVGVPSSVVSRSGFYYPRALNDGAEVGPVSGKLMVFELGGQLIFTYRRKGFHLGPFTFMLFQDEDVDYILELLPESILSQS